MLYEYIIWVLSIEGLMILSFYLWLNFLKGWNFWKAFSNNISTFQDKINLTFLLNVLMIGNHFGNLIHNLLNAIINVCDWLLINTYSTFKKKLNLNEVWFSNLISELPNSQNENLFWNDETHFFTLFHNVEVSRHFLNLFSLSCLILVVSPRLK